MTIKLETFQRVTYVCAWCAESHVDAVEPGEHFADPAEVQLPANWAWFSLSERPKDIASLRSLQYLLCPSCCAALRNVGTARSHQAELAELSSRERCKHPGRDATTMGCALDAGHEGPHGFIAGGKVVTFEEAEAEAHDSVAPESFSDRTSIGTTIERCQHFSRCEGKTGLDLIGKGSTLFCALPAGHDPKIPHQFTRKP